MQQQKEPQEDKATIAIINRIAFEYFMMDANLDEEQAKPEWQSLTEKERESYMSSARFAFDEMYNG